MKFTDWCNKYNDDDKFHACCDATLDIFKGESTYTGYKESVSRNLGGKLLVRRKLLGYTREAFLSRFGTTVEQAGYKVRILPDVDGSQWQGVVVADRKQDVREFVLQSITGYTFNEHLLCPDETLYPEQGEGTYDACKLSDKKFHELVTMATNAPSVEACTQWVVVFVLGVTLVGGSSCGRGVCISWCIWCVGRCEVATRWGGGRVKGVWDIQGPVGVGYVWWHGCEGGGLGGFSPA